MKRRPTSIHHPAASITSVRRSRLDRSGKVLVLFAIALPMLFGILGLVVDGSLLLSDRRSQQQVADAAATSAARCLAQGGSTAEAEQTAIEIVRDENGLADASVAVHVPPVSGDHAGLPDYVQVEVSMTLDTFFMQVLRDDSASTVVTRATAGYEPATVGAAVVVLDPNPPRITLSPLPSILPSVPALLGGFESLGLGRVVVDGAVLVNNEWGGEDEDGNPVGDQDLLRHGVSCTPLLPLTKLRATDIRVVGGVDDTRNYGPISGSGNPLQANRLPVPDPYADLPVPTVASDPDNVSTENHRGVTVLNIPLLMPPTVLEPGVYDYIHVVLGPVTFRKGVYIIRGTKPSTGLALSILAGPVQAEGVMFYITDSGSYSATSGAPDAGDDDSVPPGLVIGPDLDEETVPDTVPQALTLVPSAVIDATLLGNQFSPIDDPGSPYDGILIFQRRSMRNPIVIAAEQLLGRNGLSGTVYSKWGHVIFAGQGTYDARFVVGTMRFVNVLQCRLSPTNLLPPAYDVFLVE